MGNKYIQIQIEFHEEDVNLLTQAGKITGERAIDDVLNDIDWVWVMNEGGVPCEDVKVVSIGKQCCDHVHTKPCGPAFIKSGDIQRYGHDLYYLADDACACGCDPYYERC